MGQNSSRSRVKPYPGLQILGAEVHTSSIAKVEKQWIRTFHKLGIKMNCKQQESHWTGYHKAQNCFQIRGEWWWWGTEDCSNIASITVLFSLENECRRQGLCALLKSVLYQNIKLLYKESVIQIMQIVSGITSS